MESLLNSSLLIGSILLLLSVFLSKSSSKFGLPILILFMFVGIVAGNEGLGGIQYENYELTHSLSLVAICVIIFSGGLGTKMQDVKPVLKSGVVLSSFGVILTTAIVAAFSHLLFEIPVIESLLLGAILSATDAAAVFSIFRDKNAQVSKRLRSVIEFESGSNDPMAYLLVTVFLGYYQNPEVHLQSFGLQMIINPLVGFLGGYLLFKAFKFINDRLELDFQGLYPALTIGFLFFVYSSVTHMNGNGFLAVYVFGILLGNYKIAHKSALVTFFDGTSWLFQIGLFVLLGLLVFPSRLVQVAPEAVLVALFILFVARPAAVYACLLFSKFSGKEKFFISWAGLKGATPIVFASLVATKMGSASFFIFDVVFFTVLISALFQGSSIKFLAKKMGLLFEAVYDPEFPIDLEVMEKTRNGIKQYTVQDKDFAVGKRLVDLELPTGARVLFIKRAGQFIIPDGTTVFEKKDKALLVTREKSEVEECILGFQNAGAFEEESDVAAEVLAKFEGAA
ncbi:MAG: potassium/proton antiporter [Bacteriovoracaceae bacterium]